MWVDVAWTADDVDEEAVRGSTVVAIDVLRATTMIATLFHAGASQVWPVTEVDEAIALARRLGPGTLLAGERDGLPPDGFDLGNSPLEVVAERVAGRRVVLTTTNGTRAISRAKEAAHLATGAFVNGAAVIRWLTQTVDDRLYVVCAGTRGRFSLDDALCAGMLLTRFLKDRPLERSGDGASEGVSDAAKAAMALYHQFGADLHTHVASCRHGRVLHALGMEADVRYAVRLDELPVVPVRSPEDPAVLVAQS